MKITLDYGAITPTRAHETDAGLDFYTPRAFTIPPESRIFIDTGVHIQLPPNTVGFVKSKSGLMRSRGILTDGTIDEGYTGSVGIVLFNTTNREQSFYDGDKIAQVVIQPIVRPELEVVDKLDDSDRGVNGFGSTGV